MTHTQQPRQNPVSRFLYSLLHNDKKLAKHFSDLAALEIYYINGSDSLPPPLSAEREEFLLELMKTDKAAARTELIEHNLRLVVYIAKKFENTGIYIEDLISIGTIGLIKAVNTFCPVKKIKLATYASRCIENEILMYLRKNSNTRTEISLEEPLNTDWDGNELLLSDILGSDSDLVIHGVESEAESEALKKAISDLAPREKEIMQLRFGLNSNREYTQKEVADMLCISQSYISRLEKKILGKLRQKLEALV